MLEFTITLANGTCTMYVGEWPDALTFAQEFASAALVTYGFTPDADVPALRLMSITVTDDRI